MKSVVLLYLAAAGAAFAAAPPPDSGLMTIARSIGSQDYDSGLHAANQQLERNPKNAELLRLKGVCLLKENKVSEAVETLKLAVAADRDDVAARYYLAQAFAELGEINDAVRLLEGVKHDAPGSDYAKLADTILPQLKSLATTTDSIPRDTSPSNPPRRFNVDLRLAGEYDDNVPERSTAVGGPGRPESFVLVTGESVEFRLIDEKIDGAPLTLGLQYIGYQEEHDRTSVREYDVNQHTGLLYLAKRGQIGSMPIQVKLAGSYEATDLGGDYFSRTINGNFSFSLQETDWTSTTVRYGISGQKFGSETDLPLLYSRNGIEHTAGLSQFFYLFSNQLILGISYAHVWDNTDGSRFELDSNNAGISLQAALPGGFTLRTLGQYANADYVDFTPDPRRLDNVYTGTVALSHPLWSDYFTGEIAYTHSTGDSSADFAHYHRNLISLSVSFDY